MGERYQDLETTSVSLQAFVLSRRLLTRNMAATRTCLKSLVILMARRLHPSFCWQMVRDLLGFSGVGTSSNLG